MKKHVFIDGAAGTTGLKIVSRLAQRQDIDLIRLPEEERKDPVRISQALNDSDIAFLCLPDAAATEAAGMLRNDRTVLLDTSTAHRTDPGWTYGFPELSPAQKESIRSSRRIAVPGCHATGFIALAAPLVRAGLIPREALLSCFSLTGYSGGGKKMIAQYEADGGKTLAAPRQYGLGQTHKHLKEMQALAGLAVPPAFCPVVGNFYSGMEVTVPVFAGQLAPGTTPERLADAYRRAYPGPVVCYSEKADEDGFLSAGALSGKDKMLISVYGNEDRVLLTAVFDNLGKGASGAAVQCMNLAMGADETEGLAL